MGSHKSVDTLSLEDLSKLAREIRAEMAKRGHKLEAPKSRQAIQKKFRKYGIAA